MQTLIFNTTNKTVKVYNGHAEDGILLYDILNVPTVRIEPNYYEVMQKDLESTRPILRLPISNTIMFIEK
jgi:hypothetical protein